MSAVGPPTPADSPLTMNDVMSSPFHRDLMTAKLAAGEPAFLFELPTPDGDRIDIARFVGVQPVALVFGSYT
jgi:hypothetical protein